MYGIGIRNGKILDGAGSPWYYKGVGIAGDWIARSRPSLPNRKRTIRGQNQCEL